MRVLMVNKFLYPKGGAETYIFKLGEYLKAAGHEVEYFGMQDDKNIVGKHRRGVHPKIWTFTAEAWGDFSTHLG